MRKPKKTVIAINSSEDLKEFLKSYKGNKKDLLLVCENYGAWGLARNLSLDCLPYVSFDNDSKFKKFLNSINKNTQEWLNEKNIAVSFRFENENFASMFERRMISFVGRMIANFEFLDKIQKKYSVTKFLVFDSLDSSLVGTSAMHESLLAFSFEVFAKINKIEVVRINKSYYPIYIRNWFQKILLVYKKKAEIAKYLFYKFLKTRKVDLQVKILLVIPGSHVSAMIPLIKELQRRGLGCLTIVHNLLLAEKILLLENEVNFTERSDLYKEILAGAVDAKDKIKNKWKSKKNLFNFKLGKSNRSLFLNEVLKSKTESIINFELEDIIRDYLAAKLIISRINPVMVISTTDPDTRILPYLRAAQNANVKTLTIQHGAFAWLDSIDFVSDKMLVWGNYYKHWFESKLGKDPKRLVVTGSIFFDNFREKQKKPVGHKNNVILILLTNYYLRQFELEQELFRLINSLLKFSKEIVVRTHPFQKVGVIDLLSSSAKNIVVENEKPLEEVVADADIVITCDTTAGLEAVIMEKPVIYWPFYRQELLPFGKFNAAPVARSADAIIKIIKMGNESKNAKNFIKQLCFRLDGKSYMRAAQSIISEIKLVD